MSACVGELVGGMGEIGGGSGGGWSIAVGLRATGDTQSGAFQLERRAWRPRERGWGANTTSKVPRWESGKAGQGSGLRIEP